MQRAIDELNSSIGEVRKDLAAAHRRLDALQDKNQQNSARLGELETSLKAITTLREAHNDGLGCSEACPSRNPSHSAPRSPQNSAVQHSSMLSSQSELIGDTVCRNGTSLEVAEQATYRPRCAHCEPCLDLLVALISPSPVKLRMLLAGIWRRTNIVKVYN